MESSGERTERYGAPRYPSSKTYEEGGPVNLTLNFDPKYPPLTGSCASRNTSPNPTFKKNVTQASWESTVKHVGSDYN